MHIDKQCNMKWLDKSRGKNNGTVVWKGFQSSLASCSSVKELGQGCAVLLA
jgi:hypothetical protein